MISIHQLRDALRKGLFCRIKAQRPLTSNQAALRLARMEEKRAWVRRDDVTIAKLEKTVTQNMLDEVERRFQSYFKLVMGIHKYVELPIEIAHHLRSSPPPSVAIVEDSIQ